MTEQLTFAPILKIEQSLKIPVIAFTASVDEIDRIARIERAGRREDGSLTGFQRQPILDHIAGISEYLQNEQAILPNSVVIGFLDHATIEDGRLLVDVSQGVPGWLVDAQQRLAAVRTLDRPFDLLVTAFIAPSYAELRRNFIRINTVRPLPKQLIYEILPSISGMSPRYSLATNAAMVTDTLNQRDGSSLRGLIRQETTKRGILSDTVLHNVVARSLTTGALQPMREDTGRLMNEGAELISEFFWAVSSLWADDWHGHTPETSRLVHGAGVRAMAALFDTIHIATDSADRQAFREQLLPLVPQTNWTAGSWDFGETAAERPGHIRSRADDQIRSWHSLQNVGKDIRLLTEHLIALWKRSQP